MTAYIFFVGLAFLGSLTALRFIATSDMRSHLVAYRLHFPRGLDAKDEVTALAGFSGLLLPWWRRWLATPFVSLEVHANSKGISHHLIVPEGYARSIESVLSAAVPSVRFEPEDVPDMAVRQAIEYQLTSNDRPLSIDPAALSVGLLSTLQPLTGDDELVVQWIVAPHPPVSSIRQQAVTPGFRGDTTVDSELAAALKAKQAHPLLLAVGRIGATATSSAAEIQRLRRVEAAWHVARAPGVH